jgi:hypothetical protein
MIGYNLLMRQRKEWNEKKKNHNPKKQNNKKKRKESLSLSFFFLPSFDLF